jgi:hypothetical protein
MQMARENPGWGYDRIVGAMANLGHRLSDQTVGNILRRHDIPPAPKRKLTTSWKDFIRAHMAVLAATDFLTVEVLTLKGSMTYYVLFFIHLESRRICMAGRAIPRSLVIFEIRSPEYGTSRARGCFQTASADSPIQDCCGIHAPPRPWMFTCRKFLRVFALP